MTEPIEIRTTLTEADIDVVHQYLAVDSYWAQGMPRELVERCIKYCLPFALYVEGRETLVAFARVITDRTTFAYLADVFVLTEFRGRGLSKQLMQGIVDHPELQGLRRFMLMTRDAHGLYEQFGFEQVTDAAPMMNRRRSNGYFGYLPAETPAPTE